MKAQTIVMVSMLVATLFPGLYSQKVVLAKKKKNLRIMGYIGFIAPVVGHLSLLTLCLRAC